MQVDIEGILVGHATDSERLTGCTAILCPEGAVGSVDVRGGGPATRETDLLDPRCSVEQVNAVVLSGGSAFGLEASSGVMRYLCERGCGHDTGIKKVPIVCGASLFDLVVGDPDAFPNAEMGYEACVNAGPISKMQRGCVGAGTGATVGKTAGPSRMMNSGIGIDSVVMGDLVVVAISAVNAFGTVIDFDGTPIAGVRSKDGQSILSPQEAVLEYVANSSMASKDPAQDLDSAMGDSAMSDSAMSDSAMSDSAMSDSAMGNTTISCVITNAKLSKAQAAKVAAMAHDGYARAIDPVHTTVDGDSIFALATGKVEAQVNAVGIAAAWACAAAIRDAVRCANN